MPSSSTPRPPAGETTQFIAPPAPLPLQAPEKWQVGDCIDNRYLLEEKFSGAMGHVFIAQHLGWGVKMAIKVPRPEVSANKEGIQRILNEANSWINLGVHPNIAGCYFVRRTEQSALIFIEYVNGGTLAEWIAKKRCQDLRVALTIAIQFCNGMEYTHSKKIIHRDIKPQNILLTRDALVKITDFGIIRYADGPTTLTDTPVTDNNEATIGFRGTPNYASPEQLRNSHNVDYRTDIYSFGICLWLLFCGHRPYKHNSEKKCPPPQSGQLSAPLNRDMADILQKCVQYDPDARPQSFTELRQALHDIYIDHFKVACPFAQMGPVHLEAEHFNNRAVSLAELGKYKQARKFLHRALEIDDNLQQALANLHLLSWRATNISPEQMLRRLKTSQKRFPDSPLFTKLRCEVEEASRLPDLQHKGTVASRRHRPPELALSPPRAPMDLFRTNQLRLSIRDNIRSLAEQKQYGRCHTTLRRYWQENGLRRDAVLEKAYDHLLQHGQPRAIMGIQRREIVQLPTKDAVSFCHYNPTTRKLICATAAGFFRILTLTGNGRLATKIVADQPPPRSFSLRAAPVTAMTVCPSGSFLAIGLEDGRIILRSLQGKGSKSIQHNSAISALLFSHDNRWLAAAGRQGIVFYDLVKADISHFPTGSPPTAMALLPRSLNFVTACTDGTLHIRDFNNRQNIRTIEAHVLPITALALSNDGQQIATASEDRLIRVWQVKDGNCLQTIEDKEDPVNAMIFGHDNFSLFTGSATDLVKAWNIASGENIMVIDGRGDGISQFLPGPTKSTIISNNMTGSVVLWKIIYDLTFAA